jgi:hypothetical protein
MPSECLPTSPAVDSIGPLALRMRGLLVALPCLALLTVAALLHPRSSGYGTHEQLMLPPCGFLAATGWPCITCGMTTSVSAMAHGRIDLALRAQPAGAALFLAAVVMLATGAYQAITGRDALRRLHLGLAWGVLGGLVLLAGWLVRLGLGAWSGQLPLH